MELFTSTYKKSSNSRKAIALDRNYPSGFRQKWYFDLMPPPWLQPELQRVETDLEYVSLYMQFVRSTGITAHQAIKYMDSGSILLTATPIGQMCFRHVLAEWIERNTGISVREVPESESPAEALLVFN